MRSLEHSGLPIDEALPELRQALRECSSVVLTAPPGAGKSTVVPLVLLQEPWAASKRILMLEPRRLAARAVAMRMAETLGEGVGRTVGYRMRLDTRVSRDTRIEVVTEGVLTRMLQSDPALEGCCGGFVRRVPREEPAGRSRAGACAGRARERGAGAQDSGHVSDARGGRGVAVARRGARRHGERQGLPGYDAICGQGNAAVA